MVAIPNKKDVTKYVSDKYKIKQGGEEKYQ